MGMADKWKIERDPYYNTDLMIVGEFIPLSSGGASEAQGVLITTDTEYDMDNTTIGVVCCESWAEEIVTSHNRMIDNHD